MKIFLFYIGKARDANWNAASQVFIKRASRYSKVEMREIHPDRMDLWSRHAAATKVLLDPSGKMLDSREMSQLIQRHELEARDMVFIVGPHQGFSRSEERRVGKECRL